MKNNPGLICFAGCFLLVLLSSCSPSVGHDSIAAGEFYSVGGTITKALDSSEAPGALVQLLLNGKNTGRTVTAGQDGEWLFSNVSPGSYKIKASLDGYITRTSGSFAVSGDITDQDLSLEKIPDYVIGDRGPANGWIFYINTDDPSLGWTYLEAAPSDLPGKAIWGLFENWDSGITSAGLGSGYTNTRNIIRIIGDSETGTAAQLCGGYSVTIGNDVYDDWFLPSRDELNYIYLNLYKNGKSSFETTDYYWSSTNLSGYHYFSSGQRFSDGAQWTHVARNETKFVRPVRSF